MIQPLATRRAAIVIAVVLLALALLATDVFLVMKSGDPFEASVAHAATTNSSSSSRHRIDRTRGHGKRAADVARRRAVGGGNVTAVTEDRHARNRYEVTVSYKHDRYTVELSSSYSVLSVRQGHGADDTAPATGQAGDDNGVDPANHDAADDNGVDPAENEAADDNGVDPAGQHHGGGPGA